MMLKTKNNGKDEMDLWHQHSLSYGMAHVFKCASIRNMDLLSFSEVFLKSDLFKEYFVNHTIFSQSPFYVLSLFKEELKDIDIKERSLAEEDIAYWFGFLFGEWYQEGWVDFSFLGKKELVWIYQNFDTMHTQSVRYTYEVFSEERKHFDPICR